VVEIRVTAEREIGAPAGRVYRYLADYQQHHPRILPPAFSDFRVEQGGVGAGTVVTFKLTVGGRRRAGRLEVSEPEPGRLLIETELSSRLVTSFTVTPTAERCLVRIETRWPGVGVFERLFAPRALRRLYADELERLDRYAAQQPPP
jgi:uncharacterized protein YndB with AHSA1/START domain